MPLIDLFNGQLRGGALAGASTEGEHLVLRALRRVGAGEEVTVAYGSGRGLPNAQVRARAHTNLPRRCACSWAVHAVRCTLCGARGAVHAVQCTPCGAR